jgi:hypothetical protein
MELLGRERTISDLPNALETQTTADKPSLTTGHKAQWCRSHPRRGRHGKLGGGVDGKAEQMRRLISSGSRFEWPMADLA